MPSSCLDMKSNILQIGKKDRANFKSPANDKNFDTIITVENYFFLKYTHCLTSINSNCL